MKKLASISIRLSLIFSVLLLGNTVVSLAQKKAPNILVILADDLGYHDVSYYKTALDLQTPHLDALVGQGMRFDNFYANSSVCSPTRAALLSGRYPDQVGVPGVIRTHASNDWGYLSAGARLLPGELKKAGYHTALIGKWHLGLESPNTPTEHGFDFFHGWLGDMMDDYWKHIRHDINYMRRNKEIINPEGHATDLFTAWSQDYLRKRAKEKNPFFLYLAYNAPHNPLQPPDQWLEKVKKAHPDIHDKRARLVGLIEHLDEGIGKVVQTLKDEGLYENTLIVFTSDNGGWLPDHANNGPVRDGKTSMYEGGLRVPAFFLWPGKIKAGSLSKQVNTSMDLYPTLLEAAGLTPHKDVSGRSFLPTLLGADMGNEERTLYFTRREGPRLEGMCVYAVRKGDWKLVYNQPFAPMELYNLQDDPKESNNLYMQRTDKRNELTRILMDHIQASGAVPWQKPAALK